MIMKREREATKPIIIIVVMVALIHSILSAGGGRAGRKPEAEPRRRHEASI